MLTLLITFYNQKSYHKNRITCTATKLKLREISRCYKKFRNNTGSAYFTNIIYYWYTPCQNKYTPLFNNNDKLKTNFYMCFFITPYTCTYKIFTTIFFYDILIGD